MVNQAITSFRLGFIIVSLLFLQSFLCSSTFKLCEVVEDTNKKPIDIKCQIEHGNQIGSNQAGLKFLEKAEISNKETENRVLETTQQAQKYLKIFNYNIDKSGYGGDSPLEKGAVEIVTRITTFVKKEDIDLLILVEVARDCIHYGNYINTAEEIAKHLGYEFVFNPEYLIPDQSNEKHQCLIGNAIISKYKIMKYESIIFNSQCCIYPDQLGKRNAVAIEINVNNKNYKFFGTHLESGQNTVSSFFESLKVRYNQLSEIDKNITSEIKKNKNYFSEFFIAGDFNNPLPLMKNPFCPFAKLYKYHDSHSVISFRKRTTCPFEKKLSQMNLATLDYIYSYYHDYFSNSKIINDEYFYGYSDHHPIITSYELK